MRAWKRLWGQVARSEHLLARKVAEKDGDGDGNGDGNGNGDLPASSKILSSSSLVTSNLSVSVSATSSKQLGDAAHVSGPESAWTGLPAVSLRHLSEASVLLATRDKTDRLQVRPG